MEASTWQRYGCLRDDTRQERGRDCAREASAGPREDRNVGRRDLPGPQSAAMSGREQWELCMDNPTSGGRWGGEEAPPKVYELEVGHRHMGRTVKPVVYRLEESEYRRLMEEAEAEPEEQWEAMEQERYPGDGNMESPSLSRLNASQVIPRRERSRSDSESSVESRQGNKATLNSPSGGQKPSVPIRSDSFERNALLMDFILQSKQEAAASLPCVPRESSKAAEGFRQAMSFALHPDGAPHRFQNGEDALFGKQEEKSLQRMLPASDAPAAVGTTRLSRQSSTQPLEQHGGDADAGADDAPSPGKTPPAPPVRSHSRDSMALSMSRAVAMTEALLEPLVLECAQERSREEEEENVLKVADAKKTFEKPKGKAPARSVGRKAPLVQLDQGEKQSKMTKGFRTG